MKSVYPELQGPGIHRSKLWLCAEEELSPNGIAALIIGTAMFTIVRRNEA